MKKQVLMCKKGIGNTDAILVNIGLKVSQAFLNFCFLNFSNFVAKCFSVANIYSYFRKRTYLPWRESVYYNICPNYYPLSFFTCCFVDKNDAIFRKYAYFNFHSFFLNLSKKIAFFYQKAFRLVYSGACAIVFQLMHCKDLNICTILVK